MSDTPRTDAFCKEPAKIQTTQGIASAWATYARQLERELSQQSAREKDLVEAITNCINYANGRETEWGDRATNSFSFLYKALAPYERKEP